MNEKLFNALKRIKSLADTGLIFKPDDYNRERYEELRDIALNMMAELSGNKIETFDDFYAPVVDYPTPKVDVRAWIVNEKNEILLVQEKADECWTLPGGWAEVGLTPTESVLKEIEEEIGRKAKVEKLLAVFDKKIHPHPPQPFYVYKMIFECTLTDSTEKFKTAFDTMDVQYFSIDNLPRLSEDRIVQSQLELLYREHVNGNGNGFPICD